MNSLALKCLFLSNFFLHIAFTFSPSRWQHSGKLWRHAGQFILPWTETVLEFVGKITAIEKNEHFWEPYYAPNTVFMFSYILFHLRDPWISRRAILMHRSAVRLISTTYFFWDGECHSWNSSSGFMQCNIRSKGNGRAFQT